MQKITLVEALKQNFDNEYQRNTLQEAKEEHVHINKFHPCETCITVTKRDNNYWLEHYSHSLKNDVCDIRIKYNKFRKKYYFHYDSNFENVSSYIISDIEKKYEAPKNVGVLTTKKIQDWIKYNQNIYLDVKAESEKRTDNITSFLESIKGENVRFFNDGKSGEIIKNGIKYSFKIENGYVSEKIEIHYTIENSLHNFKLLADNKIYRENKLNRILENI